MNSIEIESESIEETKKLGEAIADSIVFGDVILLDGEMASGKTALSRCIFSRLGYSGVSSPTFTIINQYGRGETVSYHADAYRLNDEEDFTAAGFDECTDGELTVIEWAEKIGRVRENDEIHIEIKITGENKRLFRITARKAFCEALEGIMNEDTGN